VAVVVKTLNLAKRRTDLVEGVEEAELAEETEPHGQEHQVGPGVNDDARPAFEEDEVDACTGKGVGCCEAHRAATDDDNFEVGGTHREGQMWWFGSVSAKDERAEV